MRAIVFRKLPSLVDREFLQLVVDNKSPCLRVDPEVFYPHPTDLRGIEYAKSVCKKCPIIESCLIKALESQDQWGILGATTPDERHGMRRRRAA